MNPVTIFFPKSFFTSKKSPLSAICAAICEASPDSVERFGVERFRSSVQSQTSPSSSLLQGRNPRSLRTAAITSSSLPVKSTFPASAWKEAELVSFLSALFPSTASGVWTKSFAPSDISAKSESAGIKERPPPHVPNTTVICGITPEDMIWLFIISPSAFRASAASSRRTPAESRTAMTGAPILRARS